MFKEATIDILAAMNAAQKLEMDMLKGYQELLDQTKNKTIEEVKDLLQKQNLEWKLCKAPHIFSYGRELEFLIFTAVQSSFSTDCKESFALYANIEGSGTAAII